MNFFEEIYEITKSEWNKVQSRFKRLNDENVQLKKDLRVKFETEKLLLQKIDSLQFELNNIKSRTNARVDSKILDKYI